jgi:RNA polymerase sigma-70 factor, ECF subfamily
MSDVQAAEFEAHRAHLTGVAYRVLSTTADAEDAVQEAYLRFLRADAQPRDVRGSWLQGAARLCHSTSYPGCPCARSFAWARSILD